MVYVFLAEGFEEIEALTPVDILRRAGVEVTTVGVGGEYITGAHSITVKADVKDSDVLPQDIEMAVLPGGMPGTLNLDASDTVHAFITKAEKEGAFIAAICAAPSILGKSSLLVGKKATCYPGFEDKLLGAEIENCGVTVDGKIICGRAMGSAVEFALELVRALKGSEASEKVRSAILA